MTVHIPLASCTQIPAICLLVDPEPKNTITKWRPNSADIYSMNGFSKATYSAALAEMRVWTRVLKAVKGVLLVLLTRIPIHLKVIATV